MADAPIPLNSIEIRLRTHAILCTVGFLILLPIGALVARYTRTLPYKWVYVHLFFQFFVAAPVIAVGWSLGYKVQTELSTRFQDTHQKIGLALLILYSIQLLIGTLVHFVKFPNLFRGYRAPHNYFHVLVGLAIIVLAQYNVHYGLYIEWDYVTGGVHQVPQSAKHAWLAFVVVFWALYFLGMAFIPRQFKQESQHRKSMQSGTKEVDA